MPRHDFGLLSSQEFEELLRDLLQSEWNVALEAFKSGRDRGIDLRYAQPTGSTTIIQCKHYAISGFNKLLGHLRDRERPKIEKLAPTRYVLATTVGLTPGNKDDIVEALQPFVLGPADILGADDVEGLLSRHPQIERIHYKLWLASTEVLERVLHNAEACQTEFEVDRIRRKLPLFVHTDALPRAAELLDTGRIVVISGPPGIGKTTLAEILLYKHLERAYEPVVMRADIVEGKRLYKASARQVFYYDDFLGQLFLGDRPDYLGRNQDVALVDFIEMVRRSSDSRFILTTRPHILSSALQLSERLAHSTLLDHKCVLELADYTRGQRGRILYNHLYFSELPQSYKDAVLENDFYLTIVKHPHYNPRLIEWMSAYGRLRGVGPGDYRRHIMQMLDSPDSIWSHAFARQLSEGGREVLYCFFSLGEWVEIADLELAFDAMRQHLGPALDSHRTPAGVFRDSLHELDGAFLTYGSGHASPLNPAVREFLATVMCGNAAPAMSILAAAVRFKQIVNLWHLARARTDSTLHTVMSREHPVLAEHAARLLEAPALRWETVADGSHRGYYVDTLPQWRIAFLAELADALQEGRFVEIASAAAVLATRSDSVLPHVGVLTAVLTEMGQRFWFMAHGGQTIWRRLLDHLLDAVEFAGAADWVRLEAFRRAVPQLADADRRRFESALANYCQSGVTDERLNCNSVDEMSALRDSVDQLGQALGQDFGYQLERLHEDIAERSRESADQEEHDIPAANAIRSRADVTTDEDLKQLFMTLRSSE